MADVLLKDIRKSYGSVDVIKGVDIDIRDGEFVVFVGPSGCGKSTLLRMIAGLEDITGGTLEIGGRVVNDIQASERGIAMVFQSYAIFPHMTVRENVAFGLTIAGASKAEKDAKVADAARILQMEHLLDRRPSQLSGGQRQRVAIGRAIVRKPEVFLFDEPLSNLDAALRLDMRIEIGKLHKSLGATMVYVTHDQVEAMTLADKIVVLKDGYVQQIGAPMDLYHRPVNRFVAGFIGAPSMNFLDVEVAGRDGENARVRSDLVAEFAAPVWRDGIPSTGRATLGIRPQDLYTVDSGGVLRGHVTLAERLGIETVVDVALNDGTRLLVSLAEDRIFEPGQAIELGFDPAHAHLFAADTDPLRDAALTMKPSLILDQHFRKLEELFSASTFEALRDLCEVHGGQNWPMPNTRIDELLPKAEFYVAAQPVLSASGVARAQNLRATIEVSGAFRTGLDYEACFSRGIEVLSCSPGFRTSVAEMTLAMILAGGRGLVAEHEAFRHGAERWLDDRESTDFSLYGQTIGFIGYGQISRETHRLLAPFAPNVLAHDPYLAGETENVTLCDLETLVARCRVVVVAAVPSEDTRGLLSAKLIERLRPGALVVLISRAWCADFNALVKAAESGRITVATDVFPEEPLMANDPLRQARNVILSPHRAAAVPEGRQLIGDMILHDVTAILDGRPERQLKAADPDLVQGLVSAQNNIGVLPNTS